MYLLRECLVVGFGFFSCFCSVLPAKEALLWTGISVFSLGWVLLWVSLIHMFLNLFPHCVSLFPFINALGSNRTQVFRYYHDKNMETIHDLWRLGLSKLAELVLLAFKIIYKDFGKSIVFFIWSRHEGEHTKDTNVSNPLRAPFGAIYLIKTFSPLLWNRTIFNFFKLAKQSSSCYQKKIYSPPPLWFQKICGLWGNLEWRICAAMEDFTLLQHDVSTTSSILHAMCI